MLQESDGNLVLYRSNHVARWATGCFAEGTTLYLADGGVKIENSKNKVVWRVDSHGEESECFPKNHIDESCSDVSTQGDICRVRMIDHLNYIYAVLQTEKLSNNGTFNVVNRVFDFCGRDPEVAYVYSTRLAKSRLMFPSLVASLMYHAQSYLRGMK